MSGHSHWAGIKHKKEAADQKRGQTFSKLLAAITVAAKSEPNPGFNPRLRTAIQKAREQSVPSDKIEGAIGRAKMTAGNLEELILEAYGPGGAAILIEAVSDNKNRVIQEVKKILSNYGAKWAESGGVRWAFEPPSGSDASWQAKFPQAISADDRAKLDELLAGLLDHSEIQKVYTNTT